MKDTVLSLLKKERDALIEINRKSLSDYYDRFYRGKIEAYNEAITLICENCDDVDVIPAVVRIKKG